MVAHLVTTLPAAVGKVVSGLYCNLLDVPVGTAEIACPHSIRVVEGDHSNVVMDTVFDVVVSEQMCFPI